MMGHSSTVVPPQRRLSGGRLRPPQRGWGALATAGKVPALRSARAVTAWGILRLLALSVLDV